MIVSLIILIVLTACVVAGRLVPGLRPVKIVYDHTPDEPTPFGYRTTWLAVRTDDADRVAALLGLTHQEPANWRTGIGAVYDATLGRTALYVSRPVSGWVLVAGTSLPQPLGPRFADKTTPLLLDLGASFPDVQYFSCHADIDYFAWARVTSGKLVRGFAIGSDGPIWSHGRPDRDERALAPGLSEVRGVRNRQGDAGDGLIVYPTQAQVMALAGRWSLDPTRLQASSAEPAVGVLGQAPGGWRPERLRKSA